MTRTPHFCKAPSGIRSRVPRRGQVADATVSNVDELHGPPGIFAVGLDVGGKVVQSATGSNNEGPGLGLLQPHPYLGQNARIQIVDENTGGWGHLNADQFTFANAPALSSIQRAHWVDYGADLYAATSFTDLPHGQQILIGWMNNWNYAGDIPTSPWRSAMSVPRQLGLTTINGRLELTQQPVRQLTELRTGKPVVGFHQNIRGTQPAGISGATLELAGIFEAGSAKQFGVNVHTGKGQFTQIGYDITTHQVYIDCSKSGDVTFDPTFSVRQTPPLPLDGRGRLHLHILVDTSSVEVFDRPRSDRPHRPDLPRTGQQRRQLVCKEWHRQARRRHRLAPEIRRSP